MTTITPAPIPVTQTQSPAFRGKTMKAQQKVVDAVNKAFRENQLKEMIKTDPERAKITIMNNCTIASFIELTKKSVQGFIDKIAKKKP